jgi:hypothetical protein
MLWIHKDERMMAENAWETIVMSMIDSMQVSETRSRNAKAEAADTTDVFLPLGVSPFREEQSLQIVRVPSEPL